MWYSSGQARGGSLAPTSPIPLGSPGGCSLKKTFLKKEKFFEKTWETPSVTGGLRTGDSKKFESIRINLRDLAWSQVFPRDPGLLQPWNPGTRPGTTPGIPSKPLLPFFFPPSLELIGAEPDLIASEISFFVSSGSSRISLRSFFSSEKSDSR